MVAVGDKPSATLLTYLETAIAAWTDWAPTLTNLSGGTLVAKYVQIGKTVHYRFRYTLAGAGVGTSPSFTLPVAPATSYTSIPMGDANLLDSGTNERRGLVRLVSGSTVEIASYSTTGILTTITSTVPHTWAASDVIGVIGTYEAA